MEELMDVLNEELMEAVKNSPECADCIYNHGNGMCFFASECIENNRAFYDNDYERKERALSFLEDM